MNILLTGANGYIGNQLLYVLANLGHHVVVLVKSRRSIKVPEHHRDRIAVYESDLLNIHSIKNLPKKIDVAYYLLYSTSNKKIDFEVLGAISAHNFNNIVGKTEIRQEIHLSELTQDPHISKHMTSRHRVEKNLKGAASLTTLGVGIIIGVGSAPFEIIYDLVEKLLIMVTLRWVKNHCQPTAILGLLCYLQAVLENPECSNPTFDIDGPDILTYEEMMKSFAKERKLHRLMIDVPVLTRKLSSYWLCFVTSINFNLAQALAHDQSIYNVIFYKCMTYKEALYLTFEHINQNSVILSCKNTSKINDLNPNLWEYVEVPDQGIPIKGYHPSIERNTEKCDRLVVAYWREEWVVLHGLGTDHKRINRQALWRVWTTLWTQLSHRTP